MEEKKEQKTILIVDDDCINRMLLKKIFGADYAILEARDGLDALRVLRSMQPITAVILDLQMPELDGFGVLEQMQRDPALSTIPVIIVTGSDDSETQNRALAYGAVDVITKPFDPVTIQLRIHRLIALLRASKLEEENKWLKELAHLSKTDAKTGLWNKQTFCQETQKLLTADPGGSYALVRWDIDNFKVFNDTYGTSAGDALLLKIGEQCQLYAKDHPALRTHGHYDADHFVGLWNKDAFAPEQLHRDILAILRSAFPDYTFSVHFGMYAFDAQTLDVGIMCDRALLALRSVKNAYDEHYAWYCAAMRTEVLEEQSIVSAMKDALVKGQFIPYFQPQYNYATGKLIGAEALVRWNHPEKGLIFPDKFIPLFEKNGFIYELDRSIWEQVCVYLKKWKDEGVVLPSVSVNISRRDLYHPGLVDGFRALIEKYALDPSMLHLEITESAYVDSPDLVLNMVAQLQSTGFKVEMDDFGSGYSSLNTLKDVHVDLLKLDMAFVAPNANHSRSGSILTSVVGMAHAIRLPVIAEGVETRQQADYLKSIGCLYMQGYYFAKPMPASDFRSLLENHPVSTKQDARFYPGIDHSVDFLDATTQSTLLFNSFVGGAGILEYRGGNAAALRLNDKYYEVLGITAAEYVDKQYHLLDTIDSKYRKVFIDMLETAIRTGEEADCEAYTIPLREDAEPVCVRCQVRFLAEKVDSYIFYLSIENITERKNSQRQSSMYANIIRNFPMGLAVYEL
ncbi:bifunctional diguanylate cyclase/phosphodiesterase [Oscillibacter sp.]|uniref:putative bifunctional diguanylate cyclase/phosphodiesterase n=1 Tax=Oscillibacter sp. TaxID=1945593 RepID=UPI0026188846|nr:EAL domain-containing response regulator [Oscillibacter sp.]MDD3346669.1 EAL domain-containing protein [Oscillibacter sp.]